MVIHFPAVAFDVVVFWRAFGDAEVFARDDYVRGVGAAGPFLAVGAVAVWVLRSAMRLLRWEVESWIMCRVSRRLGAGGDVPEGSHLGLAGVFVDDLAAHAGAFCHFGGCLLSVDW